MEMCKRCGKHDEAEIAVRSTDFYGLGDDVDFHEIGVCIYCLKELIARIP